MLFSQFETILNRFSDGVGNGLLYVLSLLFTICIAMSFHEWAHAYAAYKLGDPTAKNLGRLTLDPTKHVDPIGALMFIVCGIGWAKPVMVNPRNFKNYRRDDVIVSLAGPFTNLILAFIFTGIFSFVPFYDGWYVELMSMLIGLNISFAIFNIIPLPPLDGFHVVTSIFVKKQFKVVAFLQQYGQWILLALVISGVAGEVLSFVAGGILDLFFGFFSLFR